MARRREISSENYLKGLKDVTENIQDAIDKIKHGSVKGLAKALLFVGTESQQRAPVETGDLRGSLEIDIDSTKIAEGKKGGGIRIVGEAPETGTVGTVSYNTPYAANQHEHVEYDHPLGGEAKFLEKVLNSEQDRILRLIADEVMNDLE